MGKGTDGISGGDGLGKTSTWGVNWVLFYYCLNVLTWIMGSLTRVRLLDGLGGFRCWALFCFGLTRFRIGFGLDF